MLPLLFLACTHGTKDDPTDTSGSSTEPSTDTSTDTSDTSDTSTPDTSYCSDGSYTAKLQGDGRYRVNTEHYQLSLAVRSAEEAEDYGRMAEAAWLAWSADFGAAPSESNLRLEWFATEGEWEKAIAADGDPVPVGAGGYYSPNSRTAYLWTQPTLYYNATLFLHELTHQFHFLARTGNQSRDGWYVEGIAEYESRHDWDGRCIRLGILPLLTQEDNEAQAAAQMKDGLDLGAVIRDGAGNRPVWEVIWRYLAENPETQEGFRAFRDAYDADGGIDLAKNFAQNVGDVEELGLEIAAWVPEAQEPMTPVYLDWVHVAPEAVRVESGGVLSIARLKEVPGTFSTVATEGGNGSYVGLLVGWKDSNNYDTFLVGADRSTSLFSVVRGEVVWNTVGSVPAGDGTRRLSWDGEQVTVDDTPVPLTLTSAKAAGLAVYATDTGFSGISWK